MSGRTGQSRNSNTWTEMTTLLNRKALSKESELELIQRIVMGEKDLFHELIRPHERSMYLTAYSVLQNAADAEDVAQEAALNAYRGLRNFRGDSRFSTWITTITLNVARMRLRKVTNVTFQSIDDVGEDKANQGNYTPAFLTDWRPLPSAVLEQAELRQMQNDAIASLSEMYRDVLV